LMNRFLLGLIKIKNKLKNKNYGNNAKF